MAGFDLLLIIGGLGIAAGLAIGYALGCSDERTADAEARTHRSIDRMIAKIQSEN